VIDTISEPGAWQRAIDRGCLADTIARCKACDEPVCQHPDPIFAGIIPSAGMANPVAPSRVVNGSGCAGLSHPTPPEMR
jgi:hypothetical protein